jgi:predicted nucleic acid-binding protein
VSFVIDSSVIAAWIFREIETPAIERIADLLAVNGAWVPQLFPVEMANVLHVATRRKRIVAEQAAQHLSFVAQLPLHIDEETASMAWSETYRLAEREDITVYDATYLELALRLGYPLATLDIALAKAARRRGLTVIP